MDDQVYTPRMVRISGSSLIVDSSRPTWDKRHVDFRIAANPRQNLPGSMWLEGMKHANDKLALPCTAERSEQREFYLLVSI